MVRFLTFGLVVATAAVQLGCSANQQPTGGTSSPATSSVATPSATPASPSSPGASDGTESVAADRVGGPGDYDAILKKYVKGDYFDYASLRKNAEDMARLDAFMRWQATADVKAMEKADQIAFYINAYNSCCIKTILDHYPVHSPKDIDGFFDKIKFTVGGEELTISAIEYDRLIANYKDMRAHFAVVCADRGCLPLKGSAWTGDALDTDLEAAAKKFVGDERQFKVDKEKKEIWISKIFEWYGEKFTKDPERPASKPELYLTSWVSDDVRKAMESGEYKVRIIEWEWTLNEKHKKDSQ